MKKSKPVDKKEPVSIVTGNTFYGVKWDAEAAAKLELFLECVKINSQTLETISKLFASQNVSINSLLSIGRSRKQK